MNDAIHSRTIRTVRSGRIGGAAVAGRGSPSGGRLARSRATSATTTNTSRQLARANSPATNGARAVPAAWKLENTPIARPSRAGAITSVRPASSIGVTKALATPCRARAPTNSQRLGATMHTTVAAAYPR